MAVVSAPSWITLAERFERRGIWLIEKQPNLIESEGHGLFVRMDELAHIADCFTVAKALRAKAFAEARNA